MVNHTFTPWSLVRYVLLYLLQLVHGLARITQVRRDISAFYSNLRRAVIKISLISRLPSFGCSSLCPVSFSSLTRFFQSKIWKNIASLNFKLASINFNVFAKPDNSTTGENKGRSFSLLLWRMSLILDVNWICQVISMRRSYMELDILETELLPSEVNSS